MDAQRARDGGTTDGSETTRAHELRISAGGRRFEINKYPPSPICRRRKTLTDFTSISSFAYVCVRLDDQMA